MNCLEFRRKLMEEPRNKEPDFLAHAQDCHGCGVEFQKAQSMEQLIEEALQVAPPDRLRHNILLTTRFGQAQRQRSWVLAAGLAASLLVGIGLVATSSMRMAGEDVSLSRALVSHVQHEPGSLTSEDRVPDSRLKALFRDLGADIMDDLGEVRYAGLCQIRHHLGLHLVIVGRRGPVTLFFMPGESIVAGMQFDSQDLHGAIVPNSVGSMAVLGNPGEQVQEIARQLNPRVRWQI